MIETLTNKIFANFDVILVGLLSPAFAILGIYLNNRHHSRLQQKQLEHEATQSDANRKLELRKEIYLSTIAEFTVAQQYLMELASLEISAGESTNKFNKIFLYAEQACLVASDETVSKIKELTNFYAVVFLDLLELSLPIHDAKEKINLITNRLEIHESEYQYVSKILADKTNRSRAPNSSSNQKLNDLVENHREQIEIQSNSRIEARTELQAFENKFRNIAFSKILEISRLSIPALVAIRSELGIESNIEKLQLDLESGHSTLVQRLDKFTQETLLAEDSN